MNRPLLLNYESEVICKQPNAFHYSSLKKLSKDYVKEKPLAKEVTLDVANF